MTSMPIQNDPLQLLFDGHCLPTLIQGITGRMGQRHAALMTEYGTKIVGGVTTKSIDTQKAGAQALYTSCAEAVLETGAVASVVMVPAFDVKQAVIEAVNAGVQLIVSVTEGVPVHDAVYVKNLVNESGVRWVGASTPGLAVPGFMKLGFIPDASLRRGKIGVMAKSGTLSYEVNLRLVQAGLGQSVWVGVGGDPVKGTRFSDLLPYFLRDPDTEQVLVIGEVGGDEEEELAEMLRSLSVQKPVHALVAGRSVRDGQVMGHAGAVVRGNAGTYSSKVAALRNSGVQVSTSIDDLVAGILTSCVVSPV